MDTVIYSPGGVPESESKENYYCALRLESLHASKLERFRKKLYCSRCFAKAAYVGRSTNGRAPHYRSVHQLIDGAVCPERSAESDRFSTQGYESVCALKNENNLYVVDFNYVSVDTRANSELPSDNTSLKKRAGSYRKYSEASGHGKSEWTRRLSTLLKTLMEDPKFVRSTAEIKVFGVRKPISNSFYNTERFSTYVNKLKPGKFPTFFWGPIWDANRGADGTVWLNTGEDSLDLSIAIPKEVFNVLRTKCKLSGDKPYKELNGSWFLLYGWYNKNNRTGKPYLTLLEPHHEFISLRLSY